ncbi:MAG: hypothetical protein OXD37_10460 [Acidimicrobiaceae bacterium]|nr:hypothetical protein [Acidimicrobiaceae bacterium]
MITVLRRTCTELDYDASDSGLVFNESRPLDDFRASTAYVLLGDPGAGKTTEFRRESTELGDAALMLRAKDFIELDLDSHPQWRDRILFIDGLDEMRAGKEDSRVPLGEIRNRLDRLKPPGFRIACREADWLGRSDRLSLEAVAPDLRITVLRLDELDDQRIIELLLQQHNRNDPQEFIDTARQHGVGGLLANPLTLRLLVAAVKPHGDWPESRRATLELACRQIATEHNLEHRVATPPPQTDTVVDAAGWLCALQLLCGIDGYAMPPGASAPSFASLTELSAPPGPLSHGDLEHALSTKLFRAAGEGLVPLHRHIAEFLAGRHLARLITEGVPARRVLSLMTSRADGRVVTPLRGLSAWLATHSREARPRLIDADPVGVGLYGDIEDLNSHEKGRLLKSLATFAEERTVLGHQHQDGCGYGYRDDTAWAFRCLATVDMVPAIRELLKDPSMAASNDQLAALVLEVLSHAPDPQSVADLGQDLEAILWSDTQATRIKWAALKAYLRIVEANDDRMRSLRLLLDAIQDGSVPDPDDEVRGGLLETLYPEAVTPADVWTYSPAPTRPDKPILIGHFWRFWHWTLLDKSSDRQLAELLDSLHQHAPQGLPFLRQSGLGDLPSELLARCLEANGDDAGLGDLYRWLKAAGGSLDQSPDREGPARRVRDWLEARPLLQKEIVLAWLRGRDPDDSVDFIGYWYCQALNGSALPGDFGLWCLEQALEIGDAEPRVSEGLLLEAYRSLHRPSASEGLTLEVMHERLQGAPTLAAYLESLRERHSEQVSAESDRQRKTRELLKQREHEQRQLSADWETHLRDHQDELRENRFPPHHLATLANVHLGPIAGADRHGSPQCRISGFIGGDPRLVEAVMIALREAVFRDDLPEVAQTVSWALESRHSWLARPMLVSLKMLDDEDPDRLDALPHAQKRKALAVYYCVPQGAGIPRWHDRWLNDDPDLVLGVLRQCAAAEARAGKDHPAGLDALDHAEGLGDQVHDALLGLLEAFPTRSSNQQLSLLDRLLNRALHHPDHTALLALAERKQQSKSMPVGQRVRWWATDALIVRGPRLKQLKADLAGSEVRVRHLAEFLRYIWDRHDGHRSIFTDIDDPSALSRLIEILGRWCGSPQYHNGFVTLEMAMSELIARLISQLGSGPGDKVRQALTSLLNNPELDGWHPHLKQALEEHLVIHRDGSYSHPSIEQVHDTLKDGPPAGAADLAALLMDRLTDIREDLKGDNSDFWRQFWNEDQHRRPTSAKPENSCRDALLTNLQRRLPEDVDAVREGAYAADGRSDIRASCRGFNVPIEIKKDSHPDVWKSMHNQLIDRYAIDPATDGHGVYLILWFENPDKPATRHPGGSRPDTPEELQRLLERQLTADQARKIDVIVMDVTHD